MKGSVVSLDAIARAAKAKGGVIASILGARLLFLRKVWRALMSGRKSAAPEAPPDITRAAPADLSVASRIRLILHRSLQVLLLTIAGAVALSFAWVGVYAFVNPPTTVLMLREQARLGAIHQQWTDLREIPGHIRRTMVAAEDARFCAHDGVDVDAIWEAVADAQAGRRLRGASTISQQVAKNVFLWPDRAWSRKGLELWFTALIELSWSKSRILEMYLNVAEFGEGLFGVEAAAKARFGGRLKGVSHAQAARMAVALPSPRRRNPAALSPELLERARRVEVGSNDLALTGMADCFGGA